jgi:hypothetical protein
LRGAVKKVCEELSRLLGLYVSFDLSPIDLHDALVKDRTRAISLPCSIASAIEQGGIRKATLGTASAISHGRKTRR